MATPELEERSNMTDDISDRIKRAYEENSVYRRETICLKPGSGSGYADRLLLEKLETVLRNATGGRLVDLCCGTGEHVFSLSGSFTDCVGIDFSENFIDHANRDARLGNDERIRFIVGDAKAMPLENDSVDMLFSFSALYAIPDVEAVFADVARVLKPGGRCVLDLGNSRSLNQLVIRAYPDIPPTSMIPVSRMKRGLADAGLAVVEHRCFQLLPLWANKPSWLAPLLHPRWQKIMKMYLGGKLLDERLSSLPLLRNFAFRHLIICEKPRYAENSSTGMKGRP